MRLARQIPPFLAIPFDGSTSSERHLVKSIKYKPLLIAVCFWPSLWPVWCHQNPIDLFSHISRILELQDTCSYVRIGYVYVQKYINICMYIPIYIHLILKNNMFIARDLHKSQISIHCLCWYISKYILIPNQKRFGYKLELRHKEHN